MTLQNIKEILKYNHLTGQFVWAKDKFKAKAGDDAGRINTRDGYVRVYSKKKEYKAHVLAWMYHYNQIPTHKIEHINKINNDNRICNLRLMIPKKSTSYITQEELKKVVYYNKEDGLFRWVYSFRKHKKGNKAGSYNNGYLRIEIKGAKYDLHRLVFLYVENKILDTKTQVDHINHTRSDNRYKNLRLVSNSENQRNTTLKRSNKSGVMGVHYESSQKKWTALITVNRKTIFLGRHKEKEKAINARKHAEKIYKFHINHGI